MDPELREVLAKLNEEAQWLPKAIEYRGPAGGEQLLQVTRVNGEKVLITLPQGYDYHEDGGQLLMDKLRKLRPEEG